MSIDIETIVSLHLPPNGPLSKEDVLKAARAVAKELLDEVACNHIRIWRGNDTREYVPLQVIEALQREICGEEGA